MSTPTETYAIYHDGSGKASDQLEWNMQLILERERATQTIRDFIRKHLDTLAGLRWQVDLYELGKPEIEVDCWCYRGERTSAEKVALLWPDADWKRVEPSLSIDKETQRDWCAEIDGVLIRIRKAEVFQKVKPVEPWHGTTVRGKLKKARRATEV